MVLLHSVSEFLYESVVKLLYADTVLLCPLRKFYSQMQRAEGCIGFYLNAII